MAAYELKNKNMKLLFTYKNIEYYIPGAPRQRAFPIPEYSDLCDCMQTATQPIYTFCVQG